MCGENRQRAHAVVAIPMACLSRMSSLSTSKLAVQGDEATTCGLEQRLLTWNLWERHLAHHERQLPRLVTLTGCGVQSPQVAIPRLREWNSTTCSSQWGADRNHHHEMCWHGKRARQLCNVEKHPRQSVRNVTKSPLLITTFKTEAAPKILAVRRVFE